LAPLGLEGAKLVWLFVNVELTLMAGLLLNQNIPGAVRPSPLLASALFFFSLACVLLGQTAILVFFLIVLAWTLLRRGHDLSAGVVLAWLTIKPQLTAVLLLGLLIWLARQGRWRAVGSFVVTVALLCVASTMVLPTWVADMVEAPQRTPSPTDHFPWIGNAWYLVLKSLGPPSWCVWVLYLAVALPILGMVVRTSLDRSSSLADLLSWGVLAAFFVAPYARHYDFPVLLIPALVLSSRLPKWPGVALRAALLAVPYVQHFLLLEWQRRYDPSGGFLVESTYFWTPLSLTGLWLAFALRRKTQKVNG
jgi:hypothetical protein